MVGQLTGWSIHQLVDRQVGWVIGQLVDWSVGRLVRWVTILSIDRMVTHWLLSSARSVGFMRSVKVG